jgi:hypothetical protein
MTCIATLTCIIRSDFNFAFGLLGYYMIKTCNIKKIQRTASTVSILKCIYNLSEIVIAHDRSIDCDGRALVLDNEKCLGIKAF